MRFKISIFLFSMMSSALMAKGISTQFKYNYKNLNTLGAIICSLDSERNKLAPSVVKLNKISINKKDIGGHYTVEFSGTCNSEVNIKTSEVVSYGRSLDLTLDTRSTTLITGQLGLKTISIRLINQIPTGLKITTPYNHKLKSFNLTQVSWAKTNSIVSFNSKDKISIRSKGKVIAVEYASKLRLQGIQFYNLWSFNSFGCSGQYKLAEEKCQNLINLI